MKDVPQLEQLLSQVVEKLVVNHGFTFPIRYAVISAAGDFQIGEYEPDYAGKLTRHLVEHLSDSGEPALPINVLFTDPSGRSQRVSMERGAEQMTVN